MSPNLLTHIVGGPSLHPSSQVNFVKFHFYLTLMTLMLWILQASRHFFLNKLILAHPNWKPQFDIISSIPLLFFFNPNCNIHCFLPGRLPQKVFILTLLAHHGILFWVVPSRISYFSVPLLNFIFLHTLATMRFLLSLCKAILISDSPVEQMMWSEFAKGS